MRHIKGKIYIPQGLTSDPRFILPDEVVEYTAKDLMLHTNNLTGMDPMCGVGTIPRVISNLGGTCHGIEIDPYQHSVAKKELKNGTSLILGDCTKVKTQKYDYLYTSLPFFWFNKTHPPQAVADAFKRMLKPGGILVVDSTDVAKRDGDSWDLADIQTDYFTKHGFKLEKQLGFKTGTQEVCDDIFVELKFLLV